MIEEIRKNIKEQLLAVRDTGETNMFDANAVQCIASRMGFHELVVFIEEYRQAYLNAIYTGKLPWEKEESLDD